MLSSVGGSLGVMAAVSRRGVERFGRALWWCCECDVREGWGELLHGGERGVGSGLGVCIGERLRGVTCGTKVSEGEGALLPGRGRRVVGLAT